MESPTRSGHGLFHAHASELRPGILIALPRTEAGLCCGGDIKICPDRRLCLTDYDLITIVNIGHRKRFLTLKQLEREILLSFWKAHILHHAGKSPLHGQWVILELRRHGYEISAGTLYPLLHRMERLGWLTGKADPNGGKRARKDYRLTREGRKALQLIREHIEELHEEVVVEAGVRKRNRGQIRPRGDAGNR